jgi:hypothetical protein
MMTRKTRIARTAAVIFAAAVAVFVGVVPATADINTSSVRVTDPIQSEVIAGSFDSDGTPTGFKVTLTGQATTTCEAGWQTIKFSLAGPSSVPAFSTFSSSDPSWGPASHPTKWDTQALKNGIYTVRLDVTEKTTTNLLDDCVSNNPPSASHYVTVKVANPAETPEWSSAPVAASDGSASVTLRWKKGVEDDILEYHILRSGPDGLKIAPVSAASPGAQGCSVASNVYTCQDTAFSAAYTGDYNYGIVALRERPAYNSSEDEKIECQISSKPCVVSKGSQIQGVSLVAPTPTPTPTDQPSTPPPGTTAPGTPSSKPSASGGSSSGSGGAPRVLSFGNSGGFYSGTYSETLPYTPRTMILGGGSATSSPQADGYQGEVVSETAPDFRTVMLPVAGGLLAFLSAAHVRRLLLHL